MTRRKERKSILCLIVMTSGGSRSPVLCNIRTLSIHIALISREIRVLYKHFISYCRWGAWKGGGSQLVFFLVIILFAKTAGPLKEAVGESKLVTV